MKRDKEQIETLRTACNMEPGLLHQIHKYVPCCWCSHYLNSSLHDTKGKCIPNAVEEIGLTDKLPERRTDSEEKF